MRLANDFHSWLRHLWKLLANRLTRDPKIVIHGNSCIILYLTLFKITRNLPTETSNVTLKFGLDIQSKSRNRKIQYGHQAAILKATQLKMNKLLPTATKDMHMKFETEIPKQTWFTLWKRCCLHSPETEKSIWPPGGHFENDVAENQ